MMRLTVEWTPERVERLRELRKRGFSFRQIAEHLGGVSRNAVIGKAQRLGLEAPPKIKRAPTSPPQPKRSAALRKKSVSATQVPQAICENGPPLINAEPVVSLDPSDIPAAQRVTLMELREHHCRFPFREPSEDDFFFCGARKAVGSYCEMHARVVTRRVIPAGSESNKRTKRNRRRKTAASFADL